MKFRTLILILVGSYLLTNVSNIFQLSRYLLDREFVVEELCNDTYTTSITQCNGRCTLADTLVVEQIVLPEQSNSLKAPQVLIVFGFKETVNTIRHFTLAALKGPFPPYLTHYTTRFLSWPVPPPESVAL